jgi:hypothetical protein
MKNIGYDCGNTNHLNANIDGLADRAKGVISDSLQYSSLYWAAHLSGSSASDDECKTCCTCSLMAATHYSGWKF